MKRLWNRFLCSILGHRWTFVTLAEGPRGFWRYVPVPGARCERCGMRVY